MPRPAITDTLGIATLVLLPSVQWKSLHGYPSAGIGLQNVPIVAIGNDVYCDTSLIISVLEQRFPPENGYPTIYPMREDGGSPDTGMIRALTTYYMDRPLYGLMSGVAGSRGKRNSGENSTSTPQPLSHLSSHLVSLRLIVS